MGCLRCGREPEVGALCRGCAFEIEPPDGLIPDHIHSRIDSTDALAWLVDGFGGAHAIGAAATIGRSHDGDLTVLASSVSRDHAELAHGEAGWTVRDLGSRNGTFVNGARCQEATALPDRARLKLGDVSLWFIAEVVQEPSQLPSLTSDGKGTRMRYQLERGDVELCIVVGDDRSAAGTLLWRPMGSAVWSERNLAPLEFQLLRALCLRAHDEAGSPSSIRGCVPAKQLVSDLPFQSRYANQENVRQIVLRLRGVLAEVGAAGILAVALGRGYYLACRITASAVD
jgi:hypothetical protein